MNPVVRSLIAALATFAVIWYIYWVPVAITLDLAHVHFHWMWMIRVLGSMASAVVVAQYTWRHKHWPPHGLVGCIILGSVIMGGLGFSAGWFGPMIFDPGSQGPLLGIVTGPLGFLIGAIGGAFCWVLWRREKGRVSDCMDPGNPINE